MNTVEQSPHPEPPDGRRDEGPSTIELISQGFSFTQICFMTGKTRGAVAGAVWRMKNPEKSRENSRRYRAHGAVEKKPKAKQERRTKTMFFFDHEIKEIALTEAPVEPLLVPIWDLEATNCRWSYGDVRDPDAHRFCGRPKERGSYCGGHARLAYYTPPK